MTRHSTHKKAPNRNDFYHMRRGEPIATLSLQEMYLLNPIVESSGKRKSALLLFHGFTSTPAVFRLMQPLFSDYDAVFCPALPGHATSIDALSKIHFEDWLSAAEDCARDTARNFASIDVIGFSLGGLLASHISHLISLHHLYLIAPAFDLHYPISFLLTIAKLCKYMGFRLLRNGAGDLLSNDHTEIAYRKVPISSIIELLTFMQKHLPALPQCPTDLFLGRYDHVVSPELVAKRFSTSTSTQIHWLNHSAHVIPLERDCHTIIECIKSHQKI